MRKVMKEHGKNTREDIRLRIAAMEQLAETCGKFEAEL